MTYSNNATRTRRELLIQLCRLLKDDLLEQENAVINMLHTSNKGKNDRPILFLLLNLQR